MLQTNGNSPRLTGLGGSSWLLEQQSRTMATPVEVHDVVTCFLSRAGKVLLLRRSQRVSTFRGRWSAVSGGVETDPLRQAYQEIEEECGYASDDVRLVCEGEPLIAEGEGRRFRVHPFRFEVLSPSEPRINWETVEWRWVDPTELATLDTVPRLSDTWMRVAPSN